MNWSPSISDVVNPSPIPPNPNPNPNPNSQSQNPNKRRKYKTWLGRRTDQFNGVSPDIGNDNESGKENELTL